MEAEQVEVKMRCTGRLVVQIGNTMPSLKMIAYAEVNTK